MVYGSIFQNFKNKSSKLKFQPFIYTLTKNKKRYTKWFLGILWMVILLLSLIQPKLFDTPYATILEDRNGELLSAKISSDGQWRFPSDHSNSLSEKYIRCVIQYEDKRFYYHPGIDVLSMVRAMISNFKAGKIISGGSTLTMQVVSLSRGRKSHGILDKCWEMVLAFRISLCFDKNEVIKMYADHAPFGGNTVGYGAATWRYFGKYQKELTWAESALLAVLPNNPSLIRLDRNRNLLLQKRNKLLLKLKQKKVIVEEDYLLAIEEPLPSAPLALPQFSPHVLQSIPLMVNQNPTSRIHSTIDLTLQKKLNHLAAQYGKELMGNQVNNLAILVAEVNSGKILGYVGNLPQTGQMNGEQVDIIHASRSTGSTLKPILMMYALNDGMITTQSILPDIPVNIDGFKPENFSYNYYGAIPCDEAIRKSLNIPFVLLLKQYNIARFLNHLQQLGMKRINRTADDYGLSLIIGGAESSLYELCSTYAGLARILNKASDLHLTGNKMFPLSITQDQSVLKSAQSTEPFIHPSAIWLTFDALSTNTRPGRFENWGSSTSALPIAWKTGTSIGFRDAWSIGVTSDYVVGVWIGNADGEGRPGVIGLETAAPLMFEVFDQLKDKHWFKAPTDDLQSILVCKHSGYAPSPNCEIKELAHVKGGAETLPLCNFCQSVHLDESKQYQVNSTCYDPYKMIHQNYFVLPASQQYYYRMLHPDYVVLPPFNPACHETIERNQKIMEFIYPINISRIHVAKNYQNKENPVVFHITHKSPDAIINWHMDDEYLGQTRGDHKIQVLLKTGHHVLSCVDQKGNLAKCRFEVVH